MSYDLAIWADTAPFAGLAADDAYELLCDQLEDDGPPDAQADARIADLVAALLDRWPALGEAGDEQSPWAMGPDIGDGWGPWLYVTLTFSGAEEAVPVIAAEARQRGLVCYDPQLESTI